MGFESKDSIDGLTRGDIVTVRLIPPFVSKLKTAPLVYWLTEKDDKFNGKYTYDHFIEQNLTQGSVYRNQILNYSVRRLHADVRNGILDCHLFSISRIDQRDNDYAEQRSLLEERDLWTPELQRPIAAEPVDTELIPFPKTIDNNVPPLHEMIATMYSQF